MNLETTKPNLGAALVPGIIRTFTGRSVRPLNLYPHDIDHRDIAHALANQCRFTGHTREFYSVAQHCVHVATYLEWHYDDPALVLAGLLHDASEAYLLDLASPLKKLDIFKDFRDAEERIQRAIEVRFGLDGFSLDDWRIHHADQVLLRTEMRDLMGICRETGLEMLEDGILPLPPQRAEDAFLGLLDWLAKEV